MGGLFKPDGIVMTYGTKIANLLILNILMVMFLLPVFTIGPAITAMHHTAFKISNDEEDSSIFKLFLHSFKTNFKQGVALGVLMLFCFAILVANFYCLVFGVVQLPCNILKIIYTVFMVILTLVAVFVFTWAFVLLSRYQDPLKQIIKNAVYVCMTNFKKTFVIAVLGIIPILMVCISMVTCNIALLCGFSVVAFFQATLYKKVYEQLEGTTVEGDKALQSQNQ